MNVRYITLCLCRCIVDARMVPHNKLHNYFVLHSNHTPVYSLNWNLEMREEDLGEKSTKRIKK